MLAYIATGGAIGAVIRHLVAGQVVGQWLGYSFPWGILGASTTFSMDVVALFNKGEMLKEALYISASIALFVAMQLMRVVSS